MKLWPIVTMDGASFSNPYLAMLVVAYRYLLKAQRPEMVTITHTSLAAISSPAFKLDFVRQRAEVGQPNSSLMTANFMKFPTACPMNKQYSSNQQLVEFTQHLRRGPLCKQQFNGAKHQSLPCSAQGQWGCAPLLACVVTFHKYASSLVLAIRINKHSLDHSAPMLSFRPPNLHVQYAANRADTLLATICRADVMQPLTQLARQTASWIA
jgi:hypothetical protein